jgi:hypothetical protein
MYKITLEIASNGVVKTIVDDNSNGNGEIEEIKTVYQLEGDELYDFNKTIEFLFELCEDLGLDLGSKHTRRRLGFRPEYGEKYILTEDELKAVQKDYKYELSWIREELKELKASKTKNK